MTKVLIFDLGGVLVENDMFAALKGLMATDTTEAALKSKWLSSSAAREFELGFSTPEQFATSIVEEFDIQITPQKFLDAFIGWPKGFSAESLEFLAQLRGRYRIGCLSNSNELHWTDQLTSLFDDTYSSHLINRIKPDQEVFKFVTDDLGVARNNVVFFDDSQPNVDAALAFGWDAYLTLGFEELTRVAGDIGIV